MVAVPAKDARGVALDVAPIVTLLDRIISDFRPIEIRVFGSRAQGRADASSDWDLFVVVPDDLAAADDPLAGSRLRRELCIRADIVLCSHAEFAEDRDTPNTLAYEAAHHGATIYER